MASPRTRRVLKDLKIKDGNGVSIYANPVVKVIDNLRCFHFVNVHYDIIFYF